MSVIGIDPGLDGGWARLSLSVQVEAIPTMKNGKGKRDYDRHAIRTWFRNYTDEDDLLVVENQHAFPPSFGKKTERCPRCFGSLKCALCDQIPDTCPSCDARISKASGMKGSIANFRQGQGFEIWLMIAEICDLKLELVDPRRWQGVYGIASKHGDTKEQAKVIAQEKFPTMDLRKNSRCKTVHSGIADALLIAEYGRTVIEDFAAKQGDE